MRTRLKQGLGLQLLGPGATCLVLGVGGDTLLSIASLAERKQTLRPMALDLLWQVLPLGKVKYCRKILPYIKHGQVIYGMGLPANTCRRLGAHAGWECNRCSALCMWSSCRCESAPSQ